jgi:hypothetical protein
MQVRDERAGCIRNSSDCSRADRIAMLAEGASYSHDEVVCTKTDLGPVPVGAEFGVLTNMHISGRCSTWLMSASGHKRT